MSTTQQDKSGNKRGRKADRRGQKSEQQQRPNFDQRDEDNIRPMGAPTDAPTNGADAAADVPLIAEVVAADAPSIGEAAPADHDPISIQTIANAYGDYTRKSFLESGSFVEKLMRVRSFDKAIEVQTEYARQGFANFVAESQRICELYSELAKQIFISPWERFADKVIQARR
jgi:hypothetical protein